MATTFIEPGGDATGNVAITTSNGLWNIKSSTPAVATDFVHGGHIYSIKSSPASADYYGCASITPNAGSRISFYLYLNALPSATSTILRMWRTSSSTSVLQIRLTSGGILQFADNTPTQIGTNGATLSTGVWYRICLAYTITSTTINRLELFVDAVSSISVTNGTLSTTASNQLWFGNISGNGTLDMRTSDHYVDNLTTLVDTGNIWVTAKRPNANGTTNNFNVQIGAGGSGYGSGHSPQVNERPIDTANGWSVVVVAATTEEYNIESTSTGDIDISAGTIIDYAGWVSAKTLNAETGSIIVDGASSNISLTTTITCFIKIKLSATYPAGTGADIGIITTSLATTVSLYECGIMVAYIPASVSAAANTGLLPFCIAPQGTR